ncbi:hypothetical protein L873DRAFT_1849623 [Choiromyces venosus 120613-1]|uniref:Uncharacterized protein n=1 Tax=Choiromyces venosus 120613-1 TaxID=1336337 RepID=A0A3N4ISF4_9PEZI|nr:hypothetical protein L873DRAFT_1849623 [Choiromyces venosus 120613-1]
MKMATQMHGTIASWAMVLIMAGTNAGAFGLDRTKTPDMAIVPGYHFWPTVVFEFGYTESYDDLKADVKLLLEGSAGGIIKAILIKLEPIRQGETNIQKWFVEVWHLVDGYAKKDGGRKNLFPPPRSHGMQKIELTLGDILGDEFGKMAVDGWGEDATLLLQLDSLWEFINMATQHHLIEQGVLQQG